jgi:N-acetylneuraminic acid mutarotase
MGEAAGPDGRLYVMGGSDGTNIQSTTAVYDPTLNGWTTTAPMLTPRTQLAAVAGSDGRIYAIGGTSAGGIVNTVEAYNPANGTWLPAAPLPTARAGLAAVTGPDGRIYALGGHTSLSAQNTVEAYDPATNTWATVAPMPTARDGLTAVVGPDGRIYAIGGINSSGALNTVEAYDPTTNTWSTSAPLPTARFGLASAVGADGRIYALGGANNFNSGTGTFSVLNTAEAYDPTTNTWSMATALPTPRTNQAVLAGPDGRLYSIGGLGSSLQPLANVDVLAYGPAVQVAKLTPSLTWPTPAPIPFGMALSSAQLDATASVAGSFSYTPAAGTVLPAGLQTLSVTFTPADSTDYATVAATVSLTVLPTGATRSAAGILYVVGSATSANISITLSQNVVTVALNNGTSNFQTALSGLTALVVYGQASKQHITVGSNLLLPAVLYAGNGDNAALQGGGGPTVEVGGSGKGGHLNGGSGRNILIAGPGSSQLSGGNGSGSILIGGSTDLNGNVTALLAAVNEWASTDNYSTRIAALGTTFNSTTVHDNATANALQGDGKAQSDWVFAELSGTRKDSLSGIGKGDTVTGLS